jgi:hypothetical protein
MSDASLPNLSEISFDVRSSAITAAHWPFDPDRPQEVTGTVTVSFAATANRSHHPLPNGDMRVLEDIARQKLTDIVTQFSQLQAECASLREELRRVRNEGFTA